MKRIGLCLLPWLLLSCGSNPAKKPPCPPTCQNCDEQKGCQDCTPGKNFCNGDVVQACNADGTIATDPVKTCDSSNNERCQSGDCLTPCDTAASIHSYIGCDYWPVPLLNHELNSIFDFAVAVANPLTVGEVVTNGPARVKVVPGSQPCDAHGDLSDGIAFATVSPGQVKALLLPWIPDISQNETSSPYSTQVTDGAYHLCSTLPVTVYQFNPLQFQKPMSAQVKCPNEQPPPTDGACHTFTNDASILLPSNALQGDYIVAARGTFGLQPPSTPQNPRPQPGSTPGFFTVVGTQNGTHVTVTFSAYTAGGVNIDDHKPGDQASFELQAGEVLQIVSRKPTWNATKQAPPCVNFTQEYGSTYCDLGPDYDVTGTQISADRPVAVFGGHSCSFVPYNKWACDHLEEQMFPLTTWGAQTLAVPTKPQGMEPNLFRIIAGSSQTMVTVDPPEILKPTMLNLGEWVEVTATSGFLVTASVTNGQQPRALVAQYMVGQAYADPFAFDGSGDPSLGLAVPLEQYRKSYDFLTPDTYTHSYVTVIGQAGTTFKIDDTENTIPLESLIGMSGYGYRHLELTPGAHHVTSDTAFGINVFGLARFTSYLYPGGLNLFELMPQ